MTGVIVRSARATGLLAGGAVTAGAAVLGLAFAVVVGVACLALIGLPWLPDLIRPLRELAGAERRRVSRVTGWQVPEPYHAVEGSRWQRARGVLADPASWRDLAWMLAHGCTGLVAAMVAVLLWPCIILLLTLPLWWWAAPRGTSVALVVVTS